MLTTDPRIRAAYAEGAGIYRIVPSAVAIPSDVSDVVELVHQAKASRTPLIPRGAGSGMPGGNVGSGIIVDMSTGFSELVVDPPTKVARAGASVTWAQVNDAARAYGLRLPTDPSSGAFATSGGMVATNAAGARTVRYGSVRDWVDAIEIVDADGSVRTVRRGDGRGEKYDLTADDRRVIAEGFPKTRKNSSGYALDRFAASGDEVDLLVGSEGTLAIVTAVHWRLDVIPPDTAGAALGFADLDAMAEAVPYLVSLNPSALELLDDTLLRFVPDAPRVTGLLLVEFERETAAAARGAVGDAVRGLKHMVTHVGTATDRAGLDIRALFDEVTDLLVRLGGVPSGEHGIGRLRAGVLERFYGRGVMALFRDVKRAYDPLCILNPGVIIPTTDWSPMAALKVGDETAVIPEDIATRLREVERSAAWATPKLELAQ